MRYSGRDRCDDRYKSDVVKMFEPINLSAGQLLLTGEWVVLPPLGTTCEDASVADVR